MVAGKNFIAWVEVMADLLGIGTIDSAGSETQASQSIFSFGWASLKKRTNI